MKNDNKTKMIGFEPMESFIVSMYESILDAISEINISASEFIDSLDRNKYSQTKGE